LPSISKILGPRNRTLALGGLTFILLAFLTIFQVGQVLENSWLDLLLTWRGPQPAPANLLIVGIDEPSFQEFRRPWPWPRRLHAALVQRLHAAGARLIVFDVIFADPTTPEDDDALAQAMHRAGNVILAEDLDTVKDPRFSRKILVQPIRPLREAALALGQAGIKPDPDGVVRRFQARLEGWETLAAVSAKAFAPALRAPANLTGLINYSGPSRSLDTVSYYQVLDPDKPLPAERIRGRIVLVGRMLGASPSPQARSDTFYTPFYSHTGQPSSGVELHGQVIHTLLSGQWGREVSTPGLLLFYLAAALLAAYCFAVLSPLAALLACLALALAILGASLGLFLFLNFWMAPVALVGGLALIYGGNLLDHYLVEAREKRWLRQAFGRYLAPAVVEAIIANPHRLQLGGEVVEGTVLFADLAGFTALSEDLPPQELIKLLNEYFTPLTQIILAQQGTLDKYIGDAIMAFWGAPLPLADHALRACRAVLAMQTAMLDLQGAWQSRNLPPLHTRIGLHSGPLIVGNVGSHERFDYSVLGDTVNLASRLEAVNKVYGTGTLLSETCFRMVEGHFLAREIDLVQVYGRQKPIRIYELLGETADSPPEWLAQFAEGLRCYRECLWDQATTCFREVLRLKPGDPPAKVLLNRIKGFQQYPPPSPWHGVYVMEGK
jgi:adenylate cyclase